MSSTYKIDDLSAPGPSLAVVEAVAKEEDVDPLDLPPLGECIDPFVLKRAFDDDSPMSVDFSYAGYDITIKSSGVILIS